MREKPKTTTGAFSGHAARSRRVGELAGIIVAGALSSILLQPASAEPIHLLVLRSYSPTALQTAQGDWLLLMHLQVPAWITASIVGQLYPSLAACVGDDDGSTTVIHCLRDADDVEVAALLQGSDVTLPDVASGSGMVTRIVLSGAPRIASHADEPLVDRVRGRTRRQILFPSAPLSCRDPTSTGVPCDAAIRRGCVPGSPLCGDATPSDLRIVRRRGDWALVAGAITLSSGRALPIEPPLETRLAEADATRLRRQIPGDLPTSLCLPSMAMDRRPGLCLSPAPQRGAFSQAVALGTTDETDGRVLGPSDPLFLTSGVGLRVIDRRTTFRIAMGTGVSPTFGLLPAAAPRPQPHIERCAGSPALVACSAAPSSCTVSQLDRTLAFPTQGSLAQQRCDTTAVYRVCTYTAGFFVDATSAARSSTFELNTIPILGLPSLTTNSGLVFGVRDAAQRAAVAYCPRGQTRCTWLRETPNEDLQLDGAVNLPLPWPTLAQSFFAVANPTLVWNSGVCGATPTPIPGIDP